MFFFFSWHRLKTGAKLGHQTEILQSSKEENIYREVFGKERKFSRTDVVDSMKSDLVFNILKGPEDVWAHWGNIHCLCQYENPIAMRI